MVIINYALFAEDKWADFKNQTVEQGASISGWCSQDQSRVMMDLIHKYKCRRLVEIGVFRGSSLFPIVQAVKYNRTGKVYAIDAWDCREAVRGLKSDDSAYQWWLKLDMNVFYQETVNILSQNQLQQYCSIIKKPADNAVKMFKDESIDFIHFDAIRQEDLVLELVATYFPKIKNSGFIILKDPMIRCMKQALVFLLERSDIVSAFEPSASFIVLRKNKKRSENAREIQLR